MTTYYDVTLGDVFVVGGMSYQIVELGLSQNRLTVVAESVVPPTPKPLKLDKPLLLGQDGCVECWCTDNVHEYYCESAPRTRAEEKKI